MIITIKFIHRIMLRHKYIVADGVTITSLDWFIHFDLKVSSDILNKIKQHPPHVRWSAGK